MKVVIAGGGATGCFATLLLARAGHEVLVLERDRLDPAGVDVFRAGAPQLVHPHIVMPYCRELLARRLPDVYADLLRAGVVEAPLSTQMPQSLPDTDPRPGDERLVQLMTRRSTFDLVLGQAARAEPRVTLRTGVTVTGLLAEPGGQHGKPPRVTGVRTGHGAVGADVTIDATGRRSAIDGWLRELRSLGARETSLQQAECGLAYYSRHYRIRPGALPPGALPPGSQHQRKVATLDEFLAGVWPADNGTVQVAIAPLAADRRFSAVRDAGVFTAVLRLVPSLAPWLEVLDPTTGIFVMGGLHNTLRRLVTGGVPVATGLHAIGDTVCTTNPTLARGLALAMTGAADLAAVLGEHGRDPMAQALALDELVTAHIEPYYAEQASVDGARLAQLRHSVFGDPVPERPDGEGAGADRIGYHQVRAAAAFDPVVFRAFWRVQGMIATPGEVYTDPEVVARTREILRNIGASAPADQPSREQLSAALAT
jgi:2-polyprenyl-6-methoxyphenol hydroxylase-like FAD-dependent oxidoreductase